MLLKALVQLFAEKFLQSKRAWIQHAVSPSVEAINFSITKDNAWHALTSSADGYVTFSGDASGVILEFSSGGSGFIDSQVLSRRHIIPVSKGQPFSYLVSPDSTVDTLKLIPMRTED